MPRLQKALDEVRSELDSFGLWNERLANVDVYLTWIGTAYGYQLYRTTGHIEIPAFSMDRLSEVVFGGPRRTLRDLLRHEYGHAVADTNRGLFRSRQFRAAFGTPHDSCIESEYCSSVHVSHYAATDSSEDFAEVFMYFLKHNGRIPKRLKTHTIEAKWSFISRLCRQIEEGKRKW
ncbi:hypothetical protein CA13_20970 [Planctomycetes bacterium CA13]|uniref:Uncharacterized protein n=1 Tax=Novipirellula herctigrandis TaxID=2527986 RepID=A0A5C5YZV0_9BACT|nr:hypothetical protein CA13_20970 [Planctomycetes bacterium CA13]